MILVSQSWFGTFLAQSLHTPCWGGRHRWATGRHPGTCEPRQAGRHLEAGELWNWRCSVSILYWILLVEFIIGLSLSSNILTEHANSIVRQLCQLVFIGLSWHHGCRDYLNLLTVLSASHIWSVMVLYHTYSNCLFEGGLWMIMSLFWFGFVLSN